MKTPSGAERDNVPNRHISLFAGKIGIFIRSALKNDVDVYR